MKDRVPTYPGRTKITREDGTVEHVILERADDPVEEGTPLNKGTLLDDTACTVLRIPPTAVPNDAFLALAAGAGKYGYLFTVLDDIGNPVEGVAISGVIANDGNACVTNPNGIAFGVSTAKSVSISATSPFINLQNISRTVTSTNIITHITLRFPRAASNELAITSSRNIRFSETVKSIDLTAIGGGGAGAEGGQTGNNYAGFYGGGGGGGGYVSTRLSTQVLSGEQFAVSVGSGAQIGIDRGGTSAVVKAGVYLVSAQGGGSATNYTQGMGNGNGGNGWWSQMQTATSGTNGSGYLFNESARGYAGGGGGGGGNNDADIKGGGPPYGGKGAGRTLVDGRVTAINATSPTGYGGGGGGGLRNGSPSWDANATPTAGRAGAVYIRWRYA